MATRIALTGDVGWDIFTSYRSNSDARDTYITQSYGEGVIPGDLAIDVEVPTGAAFAHIVFGKLLSDNKSIELFSHFPKQYSMEPGKGTTSLRRYICYFKPYGSSYRIKEIRARFLKQQKSDGDFTDPHILPREGQGENSNSNPNDLLVIYDGASAGTWHHHMNKTTADKTASLINTAWGRENSNPHGKTRIIVNLIHDCPKLRINDNGDEEFESKAWQLLEERKNEVCVICSITALRHANAAISKRLSWEQTIEDLAQELQHFPQLRRLTRFRHLIIRFGISAAVWIQNTAASPSESNPRHVARLIFAPLARNGIFRDPVDEGRVIGSNTLLTVELIKKLAADSAAADFDNAIVDGMQRCWAAYQAGYGNGGDPFANGNDGKTIIHRLLDGTQAALTKFKAAAPHEKSKNEFFAITIPQSVLSGQRKKWEIVRDQVDGPGNISSREIQEPVSRINVGLAIAMFGVNRVLNCNWSINFESPDIVRILNIIRRHPCILPEGEEADYMTLPCGHRPKLPDLDGVSPEFWKRELEISKAITTPSPIYAPVMTLEYLTSVERSIIESVRSIRNAMKEYVAQTYQQPLSIAVFGPPGSGKSFAVKQIAMNINEGMPDNKKLVPLEYNVAQLRDVNDLDRVFATIAGVTGEGKVPLVFFDEFDCELDGRPLGWLKYFLAPMQDGKFYRDTQPTSFGRAIFIFAGGVYSSFEEFDPSADREYAEGKKSPVGRPLQASGKLKQAAKQFRLQKGPDFVSRLRGHLNIMPLNGETGAEKPVVRRSILLRGHIEKIKLTTFENGLDVANIEEDILYALLTVDRYRHGARSMEAILKMCTKINGRIENASLPSRAQLNMHVDAEEFFIRIQRSRFRRFGQREKYSEQPSNSSNGPPPQRPGSTVAQGASPAADSTVIEESH